MSRRVRVSRPAKTDLDNIWEYVAEEQTIEVATSPDLLKWAGYFRIGVESA